MCYNYFVLFEAMKAVVMKRGNEEIVGFLNIYASNSSCVTTTRTLKPQQNALLH